MNSLYDVLVNDYKYVAQFCLFLASGCFPLTGLIFFFLLLQVVLSCIDGGPAARAGIQEGDELLEINGILLIINLSFSSGH